MIKKDLKDAFCHISVTKQGWWQLGFSWDEKTRVDKSLPFRPKTSLYLFDLFAKNLH